MKFRDQLPKIMILVSILMIYVLVGSVLLVLVHTGVLKHAPAIVEEIETGTDSEEAPVRIDPSETLAAAISYMHDNLRKPNGHINLYKPLYAKQRITQYNHTNSEAVSYYMLIAAQQGNKSEFDKELTFVEQRMLHPTGYMMWRLDDNDEAEGEGRNIAPDADLRALRALYVAKDRWGDPRYDEAINQIATALENVAINKDNILVAYAGVSGEKPWQADESYLAYSDFQVYDRLANTRGGVWEKVAVKMRNITLDAQIWNGLYNSVYFTDGRTGGKYGDHIDGGVYSINSLWIMTRFAESNDPVLMKSAQKSLDFYKDRYKKDGKIYDAYDSKGEPANRAESAWSYALIGRAAHALGDDSFAQIMARHMSNFQDMDPTSANYGAFIEGAQGDERIGQFTNQESILTMQEMQRLAPRFNE
jgi:endo-1,4-beta-D-glucanase Y